MSLKIRPAHSADASAVNELLDQLGYPQDSQAGTTNRIQTWAEDPSSAVYVAVGGDELVVSDRARGRGVGAQLVATAESFAAKRGCLRMEVTSSDRRHGAHKFYRRRGYVDEAGKSSRFLRTLPETDDPRGPLRDSPRQAT